MVGEPLRTFSVGFDDPATSELGWARLAARSVGAEHREVVVPAPRFWNELPRLIWHEDEPLAFTSSVPLYFLSRLASEHVKVVLTGEGADELFLGYNRYRYTFWNERLGRASAALLPASARRGLRRLASLAPAPFRGYAARSFLARTGEPRDLYFENFAIFHEPLRRELILAKEGISSRDPYSEGMRSYLEMQAGTLERMACADLQTYLVELLMKQDQMSMAASIESRVPFLDGEFVESAVAIPGALKVRGWRTKAVLREALRDMVPREILARKKMGFPVPVGRWLRGPFQSVVREFVLGERALRRGLFDWDVLSALAREHGDGSADHGERLWLLVNLEIWQRIFLDGEDPSSIRGCAHA
jgi:asparagine synthase (glutamine-hydrolysing)